MVSSRRVWSGLVVLLMVTLVSCAKKNEKKAVTPEDVGKTLAAQLCEKYVGCQPNPEFNKEECLQQITTGLSDRLKAKTELKVEQSMLDTCVKAITGANCDVLSSETAPAGCDFLN